jgi:hypothetical protein
MPDQVSTEHFYEWNIFQKFIEPLKKQQSFNQMITFLFLLQAIQRRHTNFFCNVALKFQCLSHCFEPHRKQCKRIKITHCDVWRFVYVHKHCDVWRFVYVHKHCDVWRFVYVHKHCDKEGIPTFFAM